MYDFYNSENKIWDYQDCCYINLFYMLKICIKINIIFFLLLKNFKFIFVCFIDLDISCRNDYNDKDCKIWVNYGYCQINLLYMLKMCKKVCN